MKKKITVLIFCAVLLALGSSAEAQQPKKVPRIGYLSPTSPSVSPTASRLSARVCANLGTSRGKTFSLNIDMQRESSTASPRSRPN